MAKGSFVLGEFAWWVMGARPGLPACPFPGAVTYILDEEETEADIPEDAARCTGCGKVHPMRIIEEIVEPASGGT
jgi:hypothetical protein